MSKRYDASAKELIEAYPADWVAFAGYPAPAAVDVINADVSTVSGAADKVLRIEGPDPWLLHFEAQISSDTSLAGRIQWYNTLVSYRHKIPVRSVVVLLRPEAAASNLTGLFRKEFPGERPYLEFRYQVVRLWKVPVATILTSGLGLLPLAPLADVKARALPGVIEQMESRLAKETQPQIASVLWAATYILMGLRYPKEVAAQLIREVRGMKESVTYQAIIDEGREKGKIEEARAILLRQGRKRFGAPDQAAVDALNAITDISRLEELSVALLDVESWQELLPGR